MQKPSRKIQSVGVAGSLSVVLMFGLTQVGVELPPEVASAISVLITTAVGYLVPNAE